MCGICGYVGLDAAPELIERMTATITHRGPDASGFFRDQDVAFGHRRLKVIDLEGGVQPMHSRDGRYVLVFNGEIYNYREIRDVLAKRGAAFHSNSDTEVLLELLIAEGPDGLNRTNGMFAFAFFDTQTRELLLARDRVGIKPLYIHERNGALRFASESKAILCDKSLDLTQNPLAIHDYLGLRYVPGTQTMFNELRRLPAGHYLRFRDGKSEIHRYWEPPLAGDGRTRTREEAYEKFAESLERAVRRRLISDVPFGAYLSGGVDSSAIVALMRRCGARRLVTFSVGFDYEHDELTQAAATARELGCEHHEIACRAEDVNLLPRIVEHMDEPMGDAINIPMFKLAEAAKREVTVILTGEGGDEILGGYLFHRVLLAGHYFQRTLPRWLRRGAIEPLLRVTPTRLLNMAFSYPAYLGDRGKLKALDYLRYVEPALLDHGYRHLISLFDDRELGSLYTPEFREQLAEAGAFDPECAFSPPRMASPFVTRMLALSYDHWLPDNMLLRTDKMSMAHAVEGRVPFLDHEFIAAAANLRASDKLTLRKGKRVLRRLVDELGLKSVATRKKMPFYVPIENYFQQPSFQELLNDLLSEESIRRRGIFEPAAIAKMREGMSRREFLFVKQVFSIGVLELWHRIFSDA